MFLDNDALSRIAEAPLFNDLTNDVNCLLVRVRNQDTFSCRKTIRFDHKGRFFLDHEVFRLIDTIKRLVRCRGHPEPGHQVLSKRLTPFELSGCLGGSKYPKSRGLK